MKILDVDEFNKIVGKSLEECREEISDSFYRGAKLMIDKVNEMARQYTHRMSLRTILNSLAVTLNQESRPQGEWIFHYRDKWMVKAECPKCHRRFEFSPRAIWKCCPMCETRMKGADDE